MTATRWGTQGWIGVGMAGLVLIVVVGAVLSGRRVRAIAGAVAAAEGPRSAALGERLRDRVLVVSAWLRTTLALGIVFIMSTKPAAGGALTGRLASGDGPHDQKRLLPRRHRVGQRGIRPLVRQVLRAGEEPH